MHAEYLTNFMWYLWYNDEQFFLVFIIAIECGLVSIFCTVVFWSSNIYLGQLLTVESNYRWVLQTAECETYTETYTPWTQKDSKNIWPVESTATMVLTSRGRFPMIDHQIMGILMRKIMRSYDLKRPGLILAAHIYIYIYVCVCYLFMSFFFTRTNKSDIWSILIKHWAYCCEIQWNIIIIM